MTGLLHDPKLLWYVARATGLVCLVMLTISVTLGVASGARLSSARWPRFLTQGLHRNVSLIVLALLAAHISVVVVDGYVPIRVLDVVVPFGSAYRPFWLGLGTLAVELLVVIAVTSLLRHRLGFGAWRAVHWASYGCWALAVVHGLGVGSDPRRAWFGWLVVSCVVVVLLAVSWRVVTGWPRRSVLRLGAVAITAVSVAALVTWARQGPLAPGWSKRAGTPPASARR